MANIAYIQLGLHIMDSVQLREVQCVLEHDKICTILLIIGAFGKVYKGHLNTVDIKDGTPTTKEVAVKTLKGIMLLLVLPL